MKNLNNILIFNGVEDLKVEILKFNDSEITYAVTNTPICQYDQHSRARVGIKFFDYKVSENPEYVLYTNLYNRLISDKQMMDKFISTAEKLEKHRNSTSSLTFKDDYNLMSRNCSYKVTQTFESLKGQMSRRLKLCEEVFIVGLHWLLREQMINKGLKFANEYLPGCDFSKSCDYASADYLSNAFGCLFAGCNRWPSHAKYASFNESCTTYEELETQLGLEVVKSEHDLKNK